MVKEATEIESPNFVLVDGHVHFHRGFEGSDFLDFASSNLLRSAGCEGEGDVSCCVLAMVDATGDDGFNRLCESAQNAHEQDSESSRPWVRRATDEPFSECFERDRFVVAIIRGRQLRTAENLEVLAIGTDADLDDGLPLGQAIASVAATGGVPVIPWGFGKWSGRRGKILRQLLETTDPAALYLGDNANRPKHRRRPQAFSRAEALGFRVLPGSDPLPFPGECHSVGRAGFSLTGELDLRIPARDLTQRLRDPTTSMRPFIDLESSIRFIRNQLRMQWMKHGLQPER